MLTYHQLLTFITTFLIFAERVESQRLIGVPSDPIKYEEISETVSVACSPESTSSAVDLKWYGPNEYNPGDPEPSLILSRNAMPNEEDGRRSRIYSQQIRTDLILFISDIESKDTGKYNCTGRVNNIPSHWSFELQAAVKLTVTAESEQTLVFGETSKIACLVQAQPAPETVWEGDEYINTVEDDKYELATDGLIVYNVKFEDAGEYICTGRVRALGKTKSVTIRVDVASRPVMSRPPVNTTGIRHRDATILCGATSVPDPHYKWYLGKDNPGDEVTSLENSDRFRPSSTNGDLTIVDIYDLDERWYWCEASNNAGTALARAYFEVYIFPVFSDSVNLNKTETREGNVVEMICQCEAKPNPRMYFKRQGYDAPYVDGHQLDSRIYVYEKPSSVVVEGQKVVPQEVVIRINATTPNDTANYTCIAENTAGRNETTMHIIIQHKPNFELTSERLRSQCIWEDEPRNITVLLSGYPQPSLAWARSDGKQISSDQDAYKIYFEPYWNNGRPDEWMANLQIDWKVTKDGLQGPYDPVGNYYPSASNNLGTESSIINVVEAALPGRPYAVNVTFKTAQSITLSAEPPVEDNCIQANAIEILYSIHGTNDVQESFLYRLDERHNMVLNDLEPGASYAIYVYAQNERGRGPISSSLIEDTLQSTAPHMVRVTSTKNSQSDNSYQVIWATPVTGGERIDGYVISWREDGATSWESRDITTSSLWWTISDLKPNTRYELMIQARNRKGLSPEQSPPDTFYTSAQDSSKQTDPVSVPLPVYYIVIIAVVGLLAVLIATDMICFCTNNWGILACICGNAGQKRDRDRGDIISLDGGEFDSQRSADGGEALSTFTTDPCQEKPQAHEYVNTARLDKAHSKTTPPYERGNYQNNSRPVPQPRVPSQINPQNQQSDSRYRTAYEDRYGGQPPNYDALTNAYRPTSRPIPAAAPYTRPSQSRYQQHQPQSANHGSQGYEDQSRSSPLPPGHRPTMI